MPPPDISACLIVRDEQLFLEGCLRSIASAVDEIVVVDTGSRDDSIEIARSFGAKVVRSQWRRDFSRARNEALAAAGCRWILYIDADERLALPVGAGLSDGLSGDDIFAARLRFRPTANSTPYREYRLFRNDPRLRFSGIIHETILPDLDRLRAGGSARIVDSAAEIVHLGYEGDLQQKQARNLQLLRVAVADDPERTYYWYDLAESFAGLKQTGAALAACEEGLARCERRRSHVATAAIASMISHTKSRLLAAVPRDAIVAADTGLGFYPSNHSLALLKARLLIETGSAGDALAILRVLRSIDGETYCDPHLGHDRRIFGVHAEELTGVALFRLGRRGEAGEAFARAAAAAPQDLSYRVRAIALGAASALPAD